MNYQFIAFIFLFMCSSAWAQCAGPSLGSANPGCSIPIDDPSSPYYTPNTEIPSPAAQPLGEWVKTWGAIAIDENGITAVVVGKMTKKEAEAAAVHDCVAGGGGECKPVYSYRNQCIAAAQGDSNGNVISRSSSIEISTRNAINTCQAQGGVNCNVYYTACTEPVFKRY